MKKTLIAAGIVTLIFTACSAEDSVAVPDALAKKLALRIQQAQQTRQAQQTQAALASHLSDEQLIELLRQRGLLPNAAPAPRNPFGHDAPSEEDLAALMTLIMLANAAQQQPYQGYDWNSGGGYGNVPGYQGYMGGTGYGWADGGQVYRNDYTGIGTGSAGGASYVIGDGFSVLVD